MMRLVARYCKIYITLLRFGFILSTTYHISFLIELAVELGYQIIYLLFFLILYANVQTIAGWTYNEMLLLIGISDIASELFVATVFLSNRELPRKIKDGDIDTVLLKPVNSLFYLTLGAPFFTSFVMILPGFGLTLYALSRLHYQVDIASLVVGSVIFLCGYCIGWAINTLFSSLSFLLTNAESLPYLGEEIIFDYKANPQQIYKGIIKVIFYVILPVVFMASVPAHTLLHGINWQYAGVSILLAGIFVWMTIHVWNLAIKNYTSASS